MEMGERLPDLGGAKEQGRTAVAEEQRSRRESRGCRALDGPSLAALLALPETKGRGRHRPEREKDGRGSFFCLPAVGDGVFCLLEPASVHNAYGHMPIPFCNGLLESV
jgi:hypothetical protein